MHYGQLYYSWEFNSMDIPNCIICIMVNYTTLGNLTQWIFPIASFAWWLIILLLGI